MSRADAASDPADLASLQEAAAWFATLGGVASAADRARWQRWLESDDRHRAAWSEVEAVNRRFAALPPRTGLKVLRAAPRPARRRMLYALAGIATTGAAGLAGWRLSLPPPDIARLALSNGGRVWINAGGRARTVRGAATETVLLDEGEVLVQSGHDGTGPVLALAVDTPAGRVSALGTRFGVRTLDAGRVQVSVFEGAVNIQPARAAARRLAAGSRAVFDADHVGDALPARALRQSWADGMLVADAMRLDDFLRELSAHRRGALHCDAAVAGLRLTGVFPLGDTDRALDAVQATLPVRIRRVGPWWTGVGPRASTDS